MEDEGRAAVKNDIQIFGSFIYRNSNMCSYWCTGTILTGTWSLTTTTTLKIQNSSVAPKKTKKTPSCCPVPCSQAPPSPFKSLFPFVWYIIFFNLSAFISPTVFRFQQFDYDVSGNDFICVFPVWGSLLLESINISFTKLGNFSIMISSYIFLCTNLFLLSFWGFKWHEW